MLRFIAWYLAIGVILTLVLHWLIDKDFDDFIVKNVFNSVFLWPLCISCLLYGMVLGAIEEFKRQKEEHNE